MRPIRIDEIARPLIVEKRMAGMQPKSGFIRGVKIGQALDNVPQIGNDRLGSQIRRAVAMGPARHALGRTDDGRLLHITFTLRDKDTKIRVISARDTSRKERGYYDQDS